MTLLKEKFAVNSIDVSEKLGDKVAADLFTEIVRGIHTGLWF